MRHARPINHPVVPVSPDRLHGERELAAPRRPAAIGLMVVEQRPVSLLGIRRLLHETDVDVLAEVSDATTAVDVAARRHPDVILIDIEVGAASVIRAITAAAPQARVVVLAHGAEDPRIAPAMWAGASGCLVVGASDELIAAVRAAAHGEPYVSAAVAVQLAPPDHGTVAAARLTPRELQVLKLLARGWDNTRIGEALYLSRGTVKHHISSILVKLNVENRIQAAVQAVRGGLLDG